MIVCKVDLRVGGAYRYVWRHTNGDEIGMHGVYREIVPPERCVNTESFEGCDARATAESLVTTVLVEQGGKTMFTARVLYPSQEVRDAVIKSGMERGAAANYDRLAELLAPAEVRSMERRAGEA